MATIRNLKEGQILWDKHRYKMGNTNVRTWGVWRVRVIEIDPNHQFIVASWNGNEAKRMYEYQVKKLKVKEPIIERRF